MAGRRLPRGGGKRLSADDLRARGVDEAFLAPTGCLDGAPEQRPPSPEPAAEEGLRFVAGPRLSPPRAPAPPPSAFSIAAAAQRPAGGRAWSVEQQRAEYGLGYELLRRMGYEGGGAAPLAAVKRQARVALQDDEALAVDDSVQVARMEGRGKRRRLAAEPRAVVAVAAASPMDDSSGSSGSACDDDDDEAALRRAVARELRASAGRIALAALARRPRVRRALAGRCEAGRGLARFLGRFVRARMPSLGVARAAAPDWMKRGAADSEEVVVFARPEGGEADADHSVDMGCSSSDDPGPPMLVAPALDDEPATASCSSAEASTAAPPSSPPPAAHWPCHGCGACFPDRPRLREHLLGRLMARTTEDPTDLRAEFDAQHRDREALGALPPAEALQCPACGWGAGACGVDGVGLLALLDHARDSPNGIDFGGRGARVPGAAAAVRLAHRRLLLLLADLVLQEPPPRPPPQRRAWRRATVPTWRSVGLQRLTALLAGAPAAAYRALEDEVLGPAEEDMFQSSADIFAA